MFCYGFASPMFNYFFFITNIKFIAMNHILKIKEIYYNHILSGEKTWELRRNDRDFKIGDTLEFVIVENDIIVRASPERFDIVYLFYPDELGIMIDYCIMSIKKTK